MAQGDEGPSKSRQTEARYADGHYLNLHPGWHEEDAAWKADQVWSMVSDHRLCPESICDIGCGTGGVLGHLAGRLPATTRLVGYEPSEEAVMLAGARTETIDFRLDDARHCRDSFDLILMLDVFEHIEDYMGFLRAMADKADRFIFHIPLDLSAQALVRVRPILAARSMTGHLHYFSKETALCTLRDTGYSVVDCRFTSGATELQRESLKTRLAVIPRKMAFRASPTWAARTLGGFSLLVLAEPASPVHPPRSTSR